MKIIVPVKFYLQVDNRIIPVSLSRRDLIEGIIWMQNCTGADFRLSSNENSHCLESSITSTKDWRLNAVAAPELHYLLHNPGQRKKKRYLILLPHSFNISYFLIKDFGDCISLIHSFIYSLNIYHIFSPLLNVAGDTAENNISKSLPYRGKK